MRQFLLIAGLLCLAITAGAQDVPSSTMPSTAPKPGTVASASGAPTIASPAPAPSQPIPFSHKKHAGELKMDCNFCHQPLGSGSALALPQSAKCTQCHMAADPKKPDITHIVEAAKNNELLQWVRIYRVPSFVTFSHKTHTNAGASCEDCHGPVAERETITLEKDLSMGGCIACHAQKNAPTDCNTCHQLNSVFLQRPKVVPAPALLASFSRGKSANSGTQMSRFLTVLDLPLVHN